MFQVAGFQKDPPKYVYFFLYKYIYHLCAIKEFNFGLMDSIANIE